MQDLKEGFTDRAS